MREKDHGLLCNCSACKKSFRFPLIERFEGDIYNVEYFLNYGPYNSVSNTEETRSYFIPTPDRNNLNEVLCEKCFLKQLLKDITCYAYVMEPEIELFTEHMLEHETNKRELFYSYQKKR